MHNLPLQIDTLVTFSLSGILGYLIRNDDRPRSGGLEALYYPLRPAILALHRAGITSRCTDVAERRATPVTIVLAEVKTNGP